MPRCTQRCKNGAACRANSKKGYDQCVAHLKVTSFECSVCMDAIPNPNGISLSCDHVFCRSCVTHWFDDGHNTCPICRRLFTPDQISTFIGRAPARYPLKNLLNIARDVQLPADDAFAVHGEDDDDFTRMLVDLSERYMADSDHERFIDAVNAALVALGMRMHF